MTLRRLKTLSLAACFIALMAGHTRAQSSAQNYPDQSRGPLERIRFFGDARLRYQYISQDAAARDANALTLRVLAAVEADVFTLTSVLIEGEGIVAFSNRFNDGTGGRQAFPFVPDPEGVALNRFQILSEIIPKTRLTLGRQRIAIDDWRFMGNFPFRQNDQTFDALRLETRAIGPGLLDMGYFKRVLRPLGRENANGRFKGNSFYINYNFATPIGRVSAFHYDFDLRGRPSQTLNASSRTTGVRVIGRHHTPSWGLIWEASYANQREGKGQQSNFSADYALASLTYEPGAFSFQARAEILGSDNGRALQTPLGSLHRFQGSADLFLQTPPDGIRDYALRAQYTFGDFKAFKKISVLARRHWFQADTDSRLYGREIDVSINTQLFSCALSADFADYQARNFASDTQTFFVTVSKSF